jgi:hypothetical protein
MILVYCFKYALLFLEQFVLFYCNFPALHQEYLFESLTILTYFNILTSIYLALPFVLSLLVDFHFCFTNLPRVNLVVFIL